MIEIRHFGDVTQYLMGAEVDGRVLYWCACYQVDELLIDTGSPNCAPELLAAVAGAGLRLAVNTHHHEDHSGGNALLQRELGLELLAPALALEPLAKGFALKPYQEVVWGRPEPSFPAPLGPELTLARRRLEVLATPGHCPDHVVLLEPDQGWAFVGDAFFSTEPKTARADEDFAQALESLRLLRRHEPKVMFLGLGQVVDQASQALDQCIEHLERSQRRIAQLAGQGLDADQIVERLFGRESSLRQLTQGHMSYRNFVAAFGGR